MGNDEGTGRIVIEGVSAIDWISSLRTKNKRYIAESLAELEKVLPPDSEEFIKTRKIFLDGFNNFTRSMLIDLIGNIEGLV